MDNGELPVLIQKYLNGLTTPEEERILLEWYRSVDHADTVVPVGSPEEAVQLKSRMLANLQHYVAGQKQRMPVYRRMWFRASAAAAVLLLIAGAYWLFSAYHNKPMKNQPVAMSPATHDAEPGGNKAILTLQNGNIIVLDSARNGLLSAEGKTSILKVNDGQIAYNAEQGNEEQVFYNTISTPNGGQYIIVLSDGTKVWLNAASSLRYPTKFTGNERKVQLTGEGYFEVVHNDKQPFMVEAEGILIKDIGTAFNINTYSNEPEKEITLVNGLASVNFNGDTKMLEAGKKATVNGTHLRLADANVEQAIAWKNSTFDFRGQTIRSIMRQISRWYDVEVGYENQVPDETYSGMISRNKNLSEVLKVLEEGGVHFSVNNRKITVRL